MDWESQAKSFLLKKKYGAKVIFAKSIVHGGHKARKAPKLANVYRALIISVHGLLKIHVGLHYVDK